MIRQLLKKRFWRQIIFTIRRTEELRDEILEAGRWAVEQAQGNGVEAEAFVLHSEDLTIEVRDGQVDTLKQAEEIGLGIRVFQGNRLGFSYTTDLKQEAVRETIRRALEGARYTADDKNNGLPGVVDGYSEMVTFDGEIEKTGLDAKVEMARQIEAESKKQDRRVKIVDSSGYEESRYSVAVVNSRGTEAFQKGAFCGLYISLMAEENGEVQTGFSVEAKRHIKELDPARVGKEGAHNAVRLLGAKGAPSRPLPCVLEPYVMTSFLGVLSGSFSADFVQKGKSTFKGKLGQAIASSQVTLVDDGTYEKGIASFPFDGEGWPSQRTALIEQGELKGFLYDSYTARKDQTSSTGNGMRGSFRGLPSVGTTNLFLQPGSAPPEMLWKDLERGLYVTEVMGMHTANPISGDFSLGASGIMIEKGKLTHPVRGVTIAGNLFDFLRDIEGIGSDLRFFGGTGSPSVRVKSLSIGGE